MRTLDAARRGAKAGRRPKKGPLALKPRIHASPESSPLLPHARARSEFICFCSICAPWMLPGVGQKRAAGPKMACSSSNYVYTHRWNRLHFCRMRERDLNSFFFPGFAGPAQLGAGKSGQRAQKWPARAQSACTWISRIASIAAVHASSI
jgi:hypothetical protein